MEEPKVSVGERLLYRQFRWDGLDMRYRSPLTGRSHLCWFCYHRSHMEYILLKCLGSRAKCFDNNSKIFNLHGGIQLPQTPQAVQTCSTRRIKHISDKVYKLPVKNRRAFNRHYLPYPKHDLQIIPCENALSNAVCCVLSTNNSHNQFSVLTWIPPYF